ncbi:hypothetical protein HYQ46_008972 [Verticillium longisporum]|nr:hypothetical protein HYQ46_008972 [Verticillium longisporum]
MNIDTPVSALPSRFLNNEFLPSPSSFDTYWYQRGGNDSNTLPSPLNFATPVVGQGPSFLREDNPPIAKRKTPEFGSGESADTGGDAKRPKPFNAAFGKHHMLICCFWHNQIPVQGSLSIHNAQ